MQEVSTSAALRSWRQAGPAADRSGRHSCLKVCKINEGRPNILDKVTNGKIQLIVNTPLGKKGATDDSYIRKAAIKNMNLL